LRIFELITAPLVKAKRGQKVVLMDRFPEKNLQGIPGVTAEIGKEYPVVKEISAQDLRDAEDEMPMGNFL
jgi:hypothetical protein